MLSRTNLGLTVVFLLLLLPAVRTCPAEGAPGDGNEIDANAARSRIIVGGRVNRVVKPDGNRFTVSCYTPGVRSGRATRRLKIDEASLIFRQAKDGRITKVDLADLYRGDDVDGFQASISPERDASDSTQLVFWYLVLPNGTERPVLESMMEIRLPAAPRPTEAPQVRGFEFKPGRGYEFNWKAAFPPVPSRLVMAGSLDRLRKPANGKFGAHYYIPGARSATFLRDLKVDKASLILRQGQDGGFSQVDLADLFRGDVHDRIVASIAFLEDPRDHARLVYWLIVKPQNAGLPIPVEVIEEPSQPVRPTTPAARANPREQQLPVP